MELIIIETVMVPKDRYFEDCEDCNVAEICQCYEYHTQEGRNHRRMEDLLLECGMQVHQPNRRKKLDEKLVALFEEFALGCSF